VRIRRVLLMLLGQVLLLVGFVLAMSGVIGLGNDAGPIETILMLLGAAVLVVLGWTVWNRAGSAAHRSPHA
jgi:threonine/homoserine/homoserine lactone efflux protein